MPSLKKKEDVQAKLKRLQKLARQTSKLSAEVFRDLVSGYSNPVPPKPKKVMLLASSNPVPPKPKLEALADLAYGAGVVEDGATALGEE